MSLGPALMWRMGADTTEFNGALTGSETRLAKFKKALAGVAAALATAEFGRRVSEAADLAVEYERLAGISGTTSEQFQRMAFAAKTVKIEHEKLGDIFRDTRDKIGDFLATGAGPMADFFEQVAPKVGVTADQFRKLSGPDALQLYYDSLVKANVSQNEMTFYLEAIASDATDLIPLLKNGGKAFDELGQSATVLSDIDVANLTKAKLELEKLDTATTIWAGKLASYLLPAIELTLTGLRTMGRLIGVVISAHGSLVSALIDTVKIGLEPVVTAFGAVADASRAMAKAVKGDFTGAKADIQGAKKDIAKALDQIAEAPDRVGERFGAMADEIKIDMRSVSDIADTEGKRAAQSLLNIARATEVVTEKTEEAAQVEEVAADSRTKFLERVKERYEALQVAQNAANAEAVKGAQETAAAVEKVATSFDMVADSALEAGLITERTFDRIRAQAQNAAHEAALVRRELEGIGQSMAAIESVRIGTSGSGEITRMSTEQLEHILRQQQDELSQLERGQRFSRGIGASFAIASTQNFVNQLEQELAARRRFANTSEVVRDVRYSPFEIERFNSVMGPQTEIEEQTRILREIREELNLQSRRNAP